MSTYKNSVLSLVYNTHAEGREKSLFMAEYIHKHGTGNFYEDTHETLEFLYRHIPLHFAYEEIVISALLKRTTLSPEEAANMYKILDEHKTLNTDFDNIKQKAAKMERGDKTQQQEFIAMVNEAIYSLIKHAEFEDKYLFPVADAKAGSALISSIEKEMSRIVS